ncbi:ComEC/Rec2 family competence protein [Intrasporangium sp. YIM S08009]|uniref:ComEC/Rec2 family competence protein n=1 Tax=Intrasporangium zincisolvens TaxID=3080018 RepID=UPI002B05C98C|nr:ComEC/Rec2 family competence protein [Intrasporangium sp. YIM S08009]
MTRGGSRGTAARHRGPRTAGLLDVRLLVPVVVAWPVVAFWGLTAPEAVVVVVALSALVAAVGLVVAARGSTRERRGRAGPVARLAAATLAVLALLLCAAAGHRAVRSAGPVGGLADEQAVVTLVGRASADPRRIGPDLSAPERAGPPLWVVRLDAEQVTGRGRTTAVSTPVLLICGGSAWAGVGWRDELVVVGRLSPAQPGDDVVAVVSVNGDPRVRDGPGALVETTDHVRERFRDATAGVWPDARGLVPALVVGDTSRTPAELTDAMQATGLSHLSAVSGTNVTLVLAAGLALCGAVRVPRRGRPLVALALLVGFVALARPEPSVVRAAVMGCVGLLALSTSRRRAGVPALGGAVAALLVWDPWLSRSFGFALSAAATLGLLVLARPWGERIAAVLPRRLAPLGPVVAVPVAAQVVCAPLVAPLQGSVSVVGVLANLLAAPLVAPTTIVGVVVAVLATAWVPAATALAWVAAVPAQGIAAVARWCDGLPGGSVPWSDSGPAAVLLAVLSVALLVVGPWAWHRGRHRPLAAAAVVVVVAGGATPTSVLSWPPPGWVVVACDVGQGDGLVVDAGDGHAVVVDTGPDPDLMRGCLDRLGVRAVDLVVLTHFHADHVDGLAGVLDRPVAEVRTSWVADPAGEADRVGRLARGAGARLGTLRAGDRLAVGPVSAEVWWPARRIDAGSVPNNASVVLTLHVRGVTVLFAGDVEREAAAAVVHEIALDPGRWGRVDVLKVAHHGSSNRDDRLVDAVTGRIALISVGAGNDYGHPAPATLRALDARGFEVHRTDLEGDVAVVTDGAGDVRAVHR